jgi:hypothetical protein
MGLRSWQARTTLLRTWVDLRPWTLNKVVLMLVIPDFARPVLSSFEPVFYHPTYQRFLVLLVAAVLATGRRTVTNLLRTAGELAHGDQGAGQAVGSGADLRLAGAVSPAQQGLRAISGNE